MKAEEKMHHLLTTDKFAPALATSALGLQVFSDYPTARAWGNNFLRKLQMEVASLAPQQAASLCKAVAQAAQTLFVRSTEGSAPDAQAATVWGACSLLLASQRLLGSALGAEQAHTVAQRCFAATYNAFITHVCHPLYAQPGFLPQRLRSMNFAHWSAPLRASVGAQAAASSTGYAQFFQRHGAPELSAIVHSADQEWTDTVEALCANAHTGHHPTRGPAATRAPASGFSPFAFEARPSNSAQAAPGVRHLVRRARYASA